jgi:hypothetical protein
MLEPYINSVSTRLHGNPDRKRTAGHHFLVGDFSKALENLPRRARWSRSSLVLDANLLFLHLALILFIKVCSSGVKCFPLVILPGAETNRAILAFVNPKVRNALVPDCSSSRKKGKKEEGGRKGGRVRKRDSKPEGYSQQYFPATPHT